MSKNQDTAPEEHFIELGERVNQFRTMALPGQPMIQHMGTAYLVSDLWSEVKRLRRICNDAGLCPDCGVIARMDPEGPFSSCGCATCEDYARRPIQALQQELMAARHRIKELEEST